MKISRQELIKMGACKAGYKRFIKQTKGTNNPVLVSSLIGGFNKTSDLLWLASNILDNNKIARFACECALLNIHEIKPYTDKYEVIVDLLKNQNQVDVFILNEIRSIKLNIEENHFLTEAYDAVMVIWHATKCIIDSSDHKHGSFCHIYADYASVYIDIDNVNKLLKNLFSGD